MSSVKVPEGKPVETELPDAGGRDPLPLLELETNPRGWVVVLLRMTGP
jgi:hypothetical protein